MSDDTSGPRARIDSVDLLRGLIMIVMALDHTRGYFGDLAASPTNLQTATAGLFFTRWITHICAPVFFLLAGTSAYLAQRRRSKAELSRFLFTRGLWLLVAEVVVLRFVMQFNLDYQVTVLTVLWALGWSMIVLAALIWLPLWAVATFGAVLAAGHHLFDGVQASALGGFGPAWSILHAPGFVINTERVIVFVAYPLIPWLGVTALGYVLGICYGWEPARRRAALINTGIALIAGFIVLRLVNRYGDPMPWTQQKSGLFTLLSFLNAAKYPPSLAFLLMTLGPSLLLLGSFDQATPRLLRPALVLGRVPFFYFLGHFFLIHCLAIGASWARFGDASGMFQSPSLDRFPITPPAGWPVSLPVVYAIWVFVVVASYPLCRWFSRVRERRRDWWLSYL